MYQRTYRSGLFDRKRFLIGLLEVLFLLHVLLFLYLLLAIPGQFHLIDWLFLLYLLEGVLVLVLF